MIVINMNKQFELTLPYLDSQKTLELRDNLIIVGANGAGKTRLGAWIELHSAQSSKVHRISAQKSLSMPDYSGTSTFEKAESNLLYGSQDANKDNGVQYKQGHRWANKPVVSMLSDYEKLMTYLFTEDYEQSTKYRQYSILNEEKIAAPETRLDIVRRIWQKILPHRELVIGAGSIKTQAKGQEGKTYNASEMSDGERVIFYLIGQCLAAPKEGIIIIDEPELHLHKSVQIPLWNELEKYREDCLFVYITHDVDFSTSKEASTKIWLKSFDGSQWEWEVIEPAEGMPERLLLEVVGSRLPVVFVEGENGSFDVSLYRETLKEYLVIPVGSCSQVIQSVKAFKANSQLHHLEIYGLIDRDRRNEKELSALETAGVFALLVAEVENLFCAPEVLEIVINKLEKDLSSTLETIKSFVFERISQELETQVSLRCNSEIKFLLGNYDESSKGLTSIEKSLSDLLAKINIKEIYSEAEHAIKDAIDNRDYKEVLKVYNRKSLASQIGQQLGFNKSEFQQLVVRLARGSSSEEVCVAIRQYFGNFPLIKNT